MKARSPHPLGRRPAFVATVAVAFVGLTACTSDPGPKRVAEDIIKTEAYNAEQAGEPWPEGVEECMLDRLGEYGDDELTSIADDLAASNATRNDEGQSALDAYEADLAGCWP